MQQPAAQRKQGGWCSAETRLMLQRQPCALSGDADHVVQPPGLLARPRSGHDLCLPNSESESRTVTLVSHLTDVFAE